LCLFKKSHIFNLQLSTPIGLLQNLSPLTPSIAVNGQKFLQPSHIINTFCCSRSFQHPPEPNPNTMWRQNISLKRNKSNSLCGVKSQKIIIWTRSAINLEDIYENCDVKILLLSCWVLHFILMEAFCLFLRSAQNPAPNQGYGFVSLVRRLEGTECARWYRKITKTKGGFWSITSRKRGFEGGTKCMCYQTSPETGVQERGWFLHAFAAI